MRFPIGTQVPFKGSGDSLTEVIAGKNDFYTSMRRKSGFPAPPRIEGE